MKTREFPGIFFFSVAIVLFTLSSSAAIHWKAPAEARELKNLVPKDAVSLEKGKRIYQTRCQICHGPQGKADGASTASLSAWPGDLSLPLMSQESDGELFWKISEGRSEMPPWELVLTSEERWLVIHYLRTLVTQP